MGEKSKADWEAIRKDYRANVMSVCAIARKYDVSDAAIHQKKKRDEARGEGARWERDLTQDIKARRKALLIRDSVRKANAESEDLIEASAMETVAVVREHRKDIAALKALEQKLISELNDPNNQPTKVHISSYQGEITETVLGLTVSERAQAAQNLASVQHKRIALERQAFNINDDDLTDGYDEIKIVAVKSKNQDD